MHWGRPGVVAVSSMMRHGHALEPIWRAGEPEQVERPLDRSRSPMFRAGQGKPPRSLHVALVYGVATLIFAAVGLTVGFIVPFSSLLVSATLPAVYAVVVPTLASFRVEAPQA
jgi:hypothetical protein